MPEVLDWSKAEIGRSYRPTKKTGDHWSGYRRHHLAKKLRTRISDQDQPATAARREEFHSCQGNQEAVRKGKQHGVRGRSTNRGGPRLGGWRTHSTRGHPLIASLRGLLHLDSNKSGERDPFVRLSQLQASSPHPTANKSLRFPLTNGTQMVYYLYVNVAASPQIVPGCYRHSVFALFIFNNLQTSLSHLRVLYPLCFHANPNAYSTNFWFNNLQMLRGGSGSLFSVSSAHSASSL